MEFSKDIHLLFNLFDPAKLDISTFNLTSYLNPFLKSIANESDIKAIILRKRNEIDKLIPTAWCGVERDKVFQPDVTLEKPLASRLAITMKEVFIEDLENNPMYGQHGFAGVENLKDGYAFPILRDSNEGKVFEGFIIYCSKKPNSFTDGQKKIIEEVNQFIEHIFFFADKINEIYLEFEEIDDVYKYYNSAKDYAKSNQIITSVKHFRAAGRQSYRLGIYEKAGELFFLAAEGMQNIGSDESMSFQIENYAESAVSYAKRANEKESRKSYDMFKCLIQQKIGRTKEFMPEDAHHFIRLIKELDSNGLDHFAGRVYVDKMDIKCRCFRNIPRKALYSFWKLTSKYGESWKRFLCAFIVIIFIFSVAYFPNPWGKGIIKLNHNSEFIYGSWDFCAICQNLITSLSFSMTVFSTLGFGNITPCNIWANICVIVEVFFGWAFVGIFVTLVGRKFLRKIY